jgi:hypothetical protein
MACIVTEKFTKCTGTFLFCITLVNSMECKLFYDYGFLGDKVYTSKKIINIPGKTR